MCIVRQIRPHSSLESVPDQRTEQQLRGAGGSSSLSCILELLRPPGTYQGRVTKETAEPPPQRGNATAAAPGTTCSGAKHPTDSCSVRRGLDSVLILHLQKVISVGWSSARLWQPGLRRRLGRGWRPRCTCSAGLRSGRAQKVPPPPAPPGRPRGVNAPPPPVRPSVGLRVCQSVRPAAPRGMPASLRSALEAASLAGCQSVRWSARPSESLRPASHAAFLFRPPVPTVLSHSALLAAARGARRRVEGGGARVRLSLRAPLPAYFTLSLSLRSGLPLSGCLAAPTCPWRGQSHP
ncbi:hypothetical protein AAY473_037669 [Plecturocebus cupreus]